jgi:hypothetical protein
VYELTNHVQFLIDGVDYTNTVLYDTVTVDNNIVMTSDTMDVTAQMNPALDTQGRPKCGQEIVWQNPGNVITAPDGSQQPYREFGGVITDVKEDVDGIYLVYQVHAKSYIQWMDRHLVTLFYNQDSPENIIANKSGSQPLALIPAYANKNGLTTFTTYNVQSTNITIIPQYFDYSKVSEAMKLIADQIEYGWYVDYYRDVHFYAAESFTSPLPNNLLDVENDTQNYGDLEIEENGEQTYNSIFLKGFKTRSSNFMVLTFNGDGQTTQWSLGYRVSSFKGDVQVQVYPSLAAYQSDTSFQSGGNPTAGATMVVARDVLDGSPDQKDAQGTAYVHYTQHLLRIGQYAPPGNAGVGAVPSGYVVACRFHYMKDAVFSAADQNAQRKIKAVEGSLSDGVYEYVHQDKSLTNATFSAVIAKGQLLLLKYGAPQILGTFDSYLNVNTAQGWRAGQFFYLKSTYRFGGQFAAGRGDAKDIMYVQRVTKKIVKNDSGGLITKSTVEFANSPYLV